MPAFEILVSRGSLAVANSIMEIKAATKEDAEKKAVELAPYQDNWKECDDEDYHYQVEESKEIENK